MKRLRRWTRVRRERPEWAGAIHHELWSFVRHRPPSAGHAVLQRRSRASRETSRPGTSLTVGLLLFAWSVAACATVLGTCALWE